MAITVTESGPVSLAVKAVYDDVAGSSNFQNRLDVDSADEAKRHIHLYIESDEHLLAMQRPLALIRQPEFSYTQIAAGATVIGGGEVAILLSDNARNRDNEDDSYMDFCNWMGDVLDDLVAAGSLDASFANFDLTIATMPFRTPRNQRNTTGKPNDFWTCELLMVYGDGDE